MLFVCMRFYQNAEVSCEILMNTSAFCKTAMQENVKRAIEMSKLSFSQYYFAIAFLLLNAIILYFKGNFWLERVITSAAIMLNAF